MTAWCPFDGLPAEMTVPVVVSVFGEAHWIEYLPLCAFHAEVVLGFLELGNPYAVFEILPLALWQHFEPPP